MTSTPLLPIHHPIQDFFICDIMDAVPKDDIVSMEHPIFSLSTKPDKKRREYSHNGVHLAIYPGEHGLATIHDKDILIYCISQLMAKINSGERITTKSLHLKAYDLLVTINRDVSGRSYEQLVAALNRLSGTRLKTNMKVGDYDITSGFGLIESWSILRHTQTGRMTEIKINLSDWIFNVVLKQEVLTIHREYFQLRKPLERRLYELVRKHCGNQASWSISLELLRKKTGSTTSPKEFRKMINAICEEDRKHNHIPGYSVSLHGKKAVFTNRNKVSSADASTILPVLHAETYQEARMVAPGHDVYQLEQEWKNFWVESGQPELRNPDAAFIGFCKKRYG